jgi:hypothetical protein
VAGTRLEYLARLKIDDLQIVRIDATLADTTGADAA